MAIDERKIGVSIIVSSLVLFIYFFLAVFLREKQIVSNVVLYLIGIALFIASYFVCAYKIRRVNENKYVLMFLYVLLLTFFAVSFYMESKTWTGYPNRYFRHRIPVVLYALVLVLFSTEIMNNAISRKEKNYLNRFFFIIVAVLCKSIFLYAPNPFFDNFGTIHHIEAYTNSIINVLHRTPYNGYTTSIYGHYAILFLFPVKVLMCLGINQWKAISITVSLVGSITFSAECYIMNKLIKRDSIFCFTVLACSVSSVQIYFNQYYQVLPHRLVFPTVTLALCLLCLCSNKASKYRNIFSLLIPFSIVWNTETGAVCTLVWWIFVTYIIAREKGHYKLSIVFKSIVCICLSFVEAYFIVCIYNFICGEGFITIKQYIYPIGSSLYPWWKLQSLLENPFNGYFVVIVVFCCIICFFVEKAIKLELNNKELMAVLIAIMGLGVFTYYINRTASSNAIIIGFNFTLLVGLILEGLVKNQECDKICKNLFSFKGVAICCCSIILGSMVLATVSSFGDTLSIKMETTFSYEGLNEFLNTADDRIPEDTIGFGYYVPMLYACLNRETGIYISDWEDIISKDEGVSNIVNNEAVDYLKQNLADNQQKHILLSPGMEIYLPNGYTKIDEFTYGMCAYFLYENKE